MRPKTKSGKQPKTDKKEEFGPEKYASLEITVMYIHVVICYRIAE